MSDKLQKFKEMMVLLQDSLTREDFLKAFSDVIEFLKKVERNLTSQIDDKTRLAEDKLDELNAIYEKTIRKIEDESTSSFSNIKRWALEGVGKLFIKSKIDEKLKILDTKLDEINKFEFPSSVGIVQEVTEKVTADLSSRIPLISDIKSELPEWGIVIRDGLERLVGDERLKIEAIDDLREELDRLRKEIKSKGSATFAGGGIRTTGVSVYSEIPTGTINGTNTVFALSQTPTSGTLRLFLNGERMKLTDDYTFTGTTITFVNAPVEGSNLIADYDIGTVNLGSTTISTASFHSETPSGLINGSNTVYTTTWSINVVLTFSINGQIIHPSEYTTSTNTITFGTALPSDLSGTSFTITYV